MLNEKSNYKTFRKLKILPSRSHKHQPINIILTFKKQIKLSDFIEPFKRYEKIRHLVKFDLRHQNME